jgi:hypothetical protein
MADFADPNAVAVDVELLPVAPTRLSPALPVGEQLLEHNLYAVCQLVAGRAARASSARQYGAIYTRFCDALRDELGCAPVVADVTADAIAAYSRDLEAREDAGQQLAAGRAGRLKQDVKMPAVVRAQNPLGAVDPRPVRQPGQVAAHLMGVRLSAARRQRPPLQPGQVGVQRPAA